MKRLTIFSVFFLQCFFINLAYSQASLNANISIDSSLNIICKGETLSFSSLGSSGNIVTYSWDFDNQFSNQNGAGPYNVIFNNSGIFNIQLSVSDGVFTDDTIISITVLDELNLNVTHINPSECSEFDGQIIFSNLNNNCVYNLTYNFNSNTVGPIQIQSNANGDFILDGLGAGNYSDFYFEGSSNGNLVPNSGFDSVVNCFTGFFAPWGININTASQWFQPTNGTPDPFNSCHTGNFLSNCAPTNFAGYQLPYNGNGYAGLMTINGQSEYREYMEIQLSSPLNAGVLYSLSFKYNLSNASSWSSNHLGLALSNNVIGPTFSPLGSNLTPQLEIAAYTTDTVNWRTASATFLANGGEEYLIVGNFFNDLNTSYVQTGMPPFAGIDMSYYYIDDIIVSNINCPIFLDTTIVLTAPLSINLPSDTVFCDAINFDLISSYNSIYSYWQDGSNSSQFHVDSPGIYSLFVDSLGCTGTDTILISLNYTPILNVNSDSICEGQTTLLVASGANEYTWQPSETLSSNSGVEVFAHPLVTTNYTVIGYNASCADTVTSIVTVIPLPNNIASAYPSEIMMGSNDPITFNVFSSNNETISWYFNGDIISNLNHFSYNFPETNGNFNVQLISTNSLGCSDTLNLEISVIEDLIYYVPNSFTPDGDEFNNVFLPVISTGIDESQYLLQVYNRWGQLVFESNDINYGWDGTFNGKQCEQGTYVWNIFLKSKYSDNKIENNGNVNLLK